MSIFQCDKTIFEPLLQDFRWPGALFGRRGAGRYPGQKADTHASANARRYEEHRLPSHLVPSAALGGICLDCSAGIGTEWATFIGTGIEVAASIDPDCTPRLAQRQSRS